MYSPIHPSIHHLLILHSFLFFLPFIHPSFFSSNIYSFFLPTIIYPSFFQSIHLCLYNLFILLYFHPSLSFHHLFINPSYFSFFPSIHQSINQPIHPSIRQSVCYLLSIYPVHLLILSYCSYRDHCVSGRLFIHPSSVLFFFLLKLWN